MMRKWMGWMLCVLLAGAPALADSAKPAEKTAGAEKSRKMDATKDAAAGVELELHELRELMLQQARELEAQGAALKEQQLKTAALEEELRHARTEERPSATPPERSGGGQQGLETQVAALADATKEIGAKVGKLEKETAEAKRGVDLRLKGIGPFSFSGDVRVRYEPFFGGGASAAPAPEERHRERFRLRFNANAKFNEDFSGGFTVSSGDTGDPISTNQTFTNFFQRKPINIDKAFVTFTPHTFKPLSVTAGKWGYTWYHTELTWDNDLNPEGISESLAWNFKNGFLQRLAVVAFQMPAFEVSAGPDSAIFGGQVQTGWKLSDRVKLAADVAYYDYRKPNAIAANQVPSGTGTTAVLAGNNNTNAFGVINGGRVFASKFGILDAVLRFDVNTGISRFPLMAQVNFAQNTRACANIGEFTAAGVTPPACNPHDRHGYWAEAQLGRAQEKGDFRFGYTFIRIEREAVVSAFNFSDLRQATNVANHRVEAYYQAYKNISLGFTGLIGRQLLTATSPTPERWLKRFQFDVIYKF